MSLYVSLGSLYVFLSRFSLGSLSVFPQVRQCCVHQCQRWYSAIEISTNRECNLIVAGWQSRTTFGECIFPVHSRFTLGSLSVHSRFTLGSLSVHFLFPVVLCTWRLMIELFCCFFCFFSWWRNAICQPCTRNMWCWMF
jgi:hypothetical protein